MSTRRGPRHQWHDDNLGRATRAGLHGLRSARPSDAVWERIARESGVAEPRLSARLGASFVAFLSGRLGRSTESLMRVAATATVAVLLTTVSATSFGVILSGGTGLSDRPSLRPLHATGLPVSEARFQPTVSEHAWDRKLPPGTSAVAWWRLLRSSGDLRPFEPACEIYHVREGAAGPAGSAVPLLGAAACGGERSPRPSLPGMPTSQPMSEVRL